MNPNIGNQNQSFQNSTILLNNKMDPCASTQAYIDKVLSRFDNYNGAHTENLENIKKQIAKLRHELLVDAEPGSELNVTGIMIWEECMKKLKDLLTRMSSEHKEMHAGISKTGKEIDKNFVHDFSGVTRPDLCYEDDAEQRDRINLLVAQHFLAQGNIDLAEVLAKEANVNLDDENKAAYQKMNSIVHALKRKELEPALEWAKLHSEKLKELLQEGPSNTAKIIHYSRNFEKYAPKYSKEIRRAMGAIMYLHTGIENSPYANLLNNLLWVEIEDIFIRDACRLLDLPIHSPLSIILNAGTVALPALLNLRQVMQQRQVIGVWGNSEELPIEIDLGSGNRYHSVFACPILRSQTSEANPPMRLTCGHCISRDALQKLSVSNRLKCPYCPLESSASEAKRVFF